MGADPSGFIYYGIDLGGEMKEKFWRAEFDYHEMNEAWDKDHRPQQPGGTNYQAPEWEIWREKNEAYRQTAEYVEMDWSGAEECENYYVHCPALEKKVEWAEQVDLGHPTLGPNAEADRWIREFCERFKLPYRQPTWHLAARYF